MTRLFCFIKNIIGHFFKLINLIRLFILNALFFTLILIIFIAIGEQEKPELIADNSYLQLNLNGFLVEQKTPVNISSQISNELSGLGENLPQEIEVKRLIEVIEHAKNDPKIIGLSLELSALKSGSLDQLSDIGDALNEFKSAGKPVISFSENYTQTQYYLASYADHISLAPNGFVLLQGYSVNRLYFKTILDSLLVTPHVFKVGTFKSFVEPFTENSMSEASKIANSHWLNQLWDGYINNVLTQRTGISNLTAQSINPTLTQLKNAMMKVSGDTAEYAVEVGLVDKLQYYDGFVENIPFKTNNQLNEQHAVNYLTYESTVPNMQSNAGLHDQIAIIYGSGEIVSGQSDANSIADKSFNKLLQQALDNDKIKAVVVRLNTPGGSAFASENIRQKILRLKAANKTVVVSMGAVSASGGYWIASAADKIVASPTTLTGSIGIFGMFATIDKSLNKLGIYQDGVSTNALSNIGITQPLSPKLAEIFQIGIENGYHQFLQVVSEGRQLSLAEVDKVSQGRVWTGQDAFENGLVDELGDLDLAIKLAASLKSLNNYDVVTIKQKISQKQIFINELLSTATSWLPHNSIALSPLLATVTKVDREASFMSRLNDPQNRYVYCTVCSVH